MTLGIGTAAPFGLITDCDKNWVGRYQAQTSELRTIDYGFSAAYRWKILSVGGGYDESPVPRFVAAQRPRDSWAPAGKTTGRSRSLPRTYHRRGVCRMGLFNHIVRFVKTPSPLGSLVQASGLLVLTGTLDYLTGYEVPVYPFYAVPILMVVWFGRSRFVSTGFTLLSALVWWWADAATGHPYPSVWLELWDVFSRLLFFYLVMVAATAVKEQRDAIRARVELLERSQKLEHEIVSISERERQSIGRDLHDGMCQYLVAIGFTADLLRQDLARQGHGRAGTAGEIVRLLQDAVERVREVARGLSPVERDEGGLELALDELALNTTQLTGRNCTFLCHEPVEIADHIFAVHLFRIAQEAISNATRHGQARNLVVALESGDGELCLRVSDDGTGFDPASTRKKPGLGLNIMRYRARLIGAALEIYPNLPTGTVVACTLPQAAHPAAPPASLHPPPSVTSLPVPTPSHP